MKKILIILIAMVTLQVTAQEKKKDIRKEAHKERMEVMKDLTPEEMATLQTKKMTLHLDLTEAQQKQIKALNLEQAKLRKAKREEHEARKEKGEMAKPSKEERLKMANEKLDHQIAMKEKMRSILNAEQFTKWEASQEKRHHKSEGKKRMMKKKHSEEKNKQ